MTACGCKNVYKVYRGRTVTDYHCFDCGLSWSLCEGRD